MPDRIALGRCPRQRRGLLASVARGSVAAGLAGATLVLAGPLAAPAEEARPAAPLAEPGALTAAPEAQPAEPAAPARGADVEPAAGADIDAAAAARAADLAIELEAAEAEAARRQAFGAGLDPVGAKKDAWPPYGVGNYRPASTGRFYGRLKSQLRHEWGDVPGAGGGQRESDTDFYQSVILGTDGLGLERLDTRFHGRWSKDIDGSADPFAGKDFFIDGKDSDLTQYEQRHLFEIYTAYARYRGVLDAVDVTVGRQYVTEVDWVHFDGISFDAPRLYDLVSVGGFLGRRVNYYRQEYDEKAVGGGHVIFHATDRIAIAVSDVASEVNLAELKVTYEPIDGLVIAPSVRMLDLDVDQLKLDVDYWNHELGLEVSFTAIRQLQGGDALEFGLASADEEFEDVRLRLPEASSFQQYQLSLYKELIAKHLGVQVGVIRHHVLRHGEASGWEASYWEPWVALDIGDLVVPGLRFDLRFTYADYHRPDVVGQTFDDAQRGEGEEDWFEIQAGARYRMQGLFTLGVTYVYREFRSHTSFFREQRFNQNGVRVHGRLDLGAVADGLSLGVEYRYDEDLSDPEDGLQRSEALWAHVEYAF